MNKMSKLFGVSNVAVLKWIRKEASFIEELNPREHSQVVMLDEVWHFVNGKKENMGLESH